jgi:acetyl-CoA carboxylase carboxyl transferase subunit alpha
MRHDHLEFEKPIIELETKIAELRELASVKGMDAAKEIESLERQADKLRSDVYSSLTPWQRVQLARHPSRPRLHPTHL